MKKNILLLRINLILLTGVGSVFCQGSSEDLAQKYFDRGMVIIETAKSNDDFKAAISEFESAKIYLNNWADVYYNLGLLYDKLEMYSNAIKNYKAYIQLAPDAEDSEEVKSLINKIEYKAEQFLNPETLTGIWYSSRPKYWSEPRLEIRINNGVVEASALVMEVAVDDLPAGKFVPLLWDSKDGNSKILVFDRAGGANVDIAEYLLSNENIKEIKRNSLQFEDFEGMNAAFKEYKFQSLKDSCINVQEYINNKKIEWKDLY